MTYHTDCFYAHPETINHPVMFMDGTVKWQKMTDREKAFYQKRVDWYLAEYATFLSENSTGVC